MNKIIALLVFLCVLMACADFFNPEGKQRPSSYGKHAMTLIIDDNLYREINLVYGGGAVGGDVHSHYITDSTCFRKYIGKTMDDEGFILHHGKKSGILYVIKVDYNGDVIKCFALHIDELKKKGEWD